MEAPLSTVRASSTHRREPRHGRAGACPRPAPDLWADHNHGSRHVRALDRPSVRRCGSAEPPRSDCRGGRLAIVSELVDVAQPLRLRERHSRDHRPAGRRPRRCICTRAGLGDSDLTGAKDEREQRVCRQGRDDRYAWPSDSRVIEVAASHGTARAHATRDRACSESAAQPTWRAVAIADIQACGH